jgi:co-chaperonin GroES (HSP10)
MKIEPRIGYVLVSDQEVIEEKKSSLILPGEEKKKTYLRLESDGEFYKKGDCVFAQPFKTKMEIEKNLFLIKEDDIVASFTNIDAHSVSH